jgi:hypothetical protein
MQLVVYSPTPSSVHEFVTFWGQQYSDAREELYTTNINKPITAETIRDLFVWKNGMRLSRLKSKSIELKYIQRLPELRRLSSSTDPRTFLQTFKEGGAIWRIFMLHCWSHGRYPIYDQHVHRAMTFITEQQREEIETWSDDKRVHAYLSRYLNFTRTLNGESPRMIDRALWMFGRFIKTATLPDLVNKGYGRQAVPDELP